MLPGDEQILLHKLLHHFRHARHVAAYNSNSHKQAELPMGYITFDWLLGVSEADAVVLSSPYFECLDALYKEQPDFYLGYLAYDLKNETERLESRHPDYAEFPPVLFFRPQLLIVCSGGQLKILRNESGTAWSQHLIEQLPAVPEGSFPAVSIQCRTTRSRYLEQVENIRQAIAEGTVYELNYCLEWYNEQADIDPLMLYRRINHLSPTPFSAYLQADGKYLISGSPERFFARYQQTLFSQPIKGTRKRSPDMEEDMLLKRGLEEDEKERAENVMIVDLVRNDFAKSCVPGSVKVPELMQVYSFPTVHQMISTITGTLRPEVTVIQAIRNAFPMGSMTGAPKIKAMELIDALEDGRRSLYSGAFGYLSPEGNCDFNVVIRSILYNRNNQYLSFQTGGAITYDSVPEKEWDECQLKAETMQKALSGA